MITIKVLGCREDLEAELVRRNLFPMAIFGEPMEGIHTAMLAETDENARAVRDWYEDRVSAPFPAGTLVAFGMKRL